MSSGPARNYRLAAGVVAAGGYQRIYTVPSGYVCLLKSMLCCNLASDPTSGWFELHTPGAQIDIVFSNIAYTAHFEWLYSSAGSLNYLLAGALLSGFTSVPA
jgi:hypothetical protein